MDLNKLTPAPWQAGLDMPECANNDTRSNVLWHGSESIAVIHSPWKSDDVHCANAEFIALARNAFDIMMRRNWSPDWWGESSGTYEDGLPTGGWRLSFESCGGETDAMFRWNNEHAWPDPFTALVEAEKWYREHVEKVSYPCQP